MGRGNSAQLARGRGLILVARTARGLRLVHIIHSNATGYAGHIEGIQRGSIIAGVCLHWLRLRAYGQLLLLQLHRELHATHLAIAKIQASHNVLAQLVRGLEQAEASNKAALVRNPIELGSTPCGHILQTNR